MVDQVENVSCVIQFNNNPDAVYFSGQTVSGTAILTLLKSQRLSNVSIIISGSAETKWTIGSEDSQRIHRGKELLLNSEKVLQGAFSEIGRITYVFNNKSNINIFDYRHLQ